MLIDNFNNSVDFLEFVYGFYKTIKANEIRLVYEGKITHQITKAFIALAEAQMAEDQETVRVQRIIFHVMVECLQNISRYADDHESRDNIYSGRGIFMISKNSDIYCITTGNAILNDKIPALKKMIDRVNELDEPMLKDFYIKQMREGRLSEKGGAGLGFIDIRRKTGSKLDYHFLPISDNISFFMLTTTIPRTY
jgi:hypothetical protein